jgi:hypothetical protein
VFAGDVARLITDLCRTDLLVEIEGISPRVRPQAPVPV